MDSSTDVNLIFPGIDLVYNWTTYQDFETFNITDYSSYDEDYILKQMTYTLYGLIFVLGSIGNGLVIWIAGFRMKKTIGAVWFLNLAIADFLCCASLALRIIEWVYIFASFRDRDIICTFNIILFNLNVSASVLFLVAMSIDRCVSVMWPFWAKFHRTDKVVKITAAIIWGLSFLLTGLVIYLYKFHFIHYYEWCVTAQYTNLYPRNIKQIIRLFRLLIMFVIPFLIILISYVIVFLKLRKCKRSQRSRRPYRIITAVILGFFICWLPYYIWPMIPLHDQSTDHILYYTINTIVTILACLNSCMNPIIYVFMGQDVKLCFFRSIPARVERALSEHPNDQSPEPEGCENTPTTDV